MALLHEQGRCHGADVYKRQALARNEDDVPQTGLVDGRGNGSGPGRKEGVSAFRQSRRNLADDGEGFLASGIVGGDDAGV